MIKVVSLVKRRPGMTREQFFDYYETKHRKLGEKYHRGNATKYVRRYFEPLPNPVTGAIAEPEYDCIMEVWFENREKMESTMALFAAPDVAAAIAKDEEQFVDRSKVLLYTVNEHESDL